jgi:hypothetical protein
MKEAKKSKCEKCNTYFYTHTHHTLPKAIFGKDVPTAELCPNCHTHFHEYSKQHTTEPTNRVEAQNIWEYWLRYVPVIVTMLVLAFLGFVYA